MIKVDFKELQAIEETMNTYAQGTLKAGEEGVALMKKAFHEDAIMWGWYTTGQLAQGHIQGLYDVIVPAPSVIDYKMRMDIMDVCESIAFVRVELDKIWADETKKFTDYHALIKVDGQWRIVAKVFAQHKLDAPMQRAGFEEIKGIEKTLSTYANGTLYAGAAGVGLMKKAFLPEAVMWGHYTNGTMAKGSVQGLYDVIEPAATVTDYNMRVDILDIHETIAAARVELDKIWGDEMKTFTDYHTLIKIDGEWRIIGKCFAQH